MKVARVLARLAYGLFICLAFEAATACAGSSSEATAIADGFVKSFATTCGSSLAFLAGYYGSVGDELLQLKDPKITVVQGKVDEASKLNGVEWTGEIAIKFSAYRVGKKSDGWEQWRAPDRDWYVLPFSKVNGTWKHSDKLLDVRLSDGVEVNASDSSSLTTKKPICSPGGDPDWPSS